jgi:HemY protein
VIRILFTIVQIAVVVATAVWLADQPGQVTIDWQGWRIETTFWLLAVAIIVFVVVAAIAYRSWRFLRRAPRKLVEATRASRQRRGYKALTHGMVALAAGDASDALSYARRASSLLDDAPLTMLLTAQAAQLGGDEAAAKRYFEAMRSNPVTAFLAVRGLLNQAVKADDRAEAVRLANEAHALRPKTGWVLEQLFELQIAANQWQAADETMQEAVRYKTIDKIEASKRRAAILVERGRGALAKGETVAALDHARMAYDLNPELIPAAILYAQQLAASSRNRRAIRVLEDAWRRQPSSEIAEAYRTLNASDDVLAQVKRMERLLEVAPDHVESHVALGVAALEAKLWGEARKHLTVAAEMAPTARLCRLMADLEEATDGDQINVQEWLTKAVAAEPENGWVCGRCGAAACLWTARCGNCEIFNTLEWRTPPRVFALGGGEGSAAPEVDALAVGS